MTEIANKSILEIVEANYHTTAIFEKYGIQFFEQSKDETLKEYCSRNQLEIEKIIEDIKEVSSTRFFTHRLPFERWKLEFLMDYIKHVYHDYATITGPQIEKMMVDVVNICPSEKTYLGELLELIRKLNESIGSHIEYEEDMIFPYIKQLENLLENNEGFGYLFVRTLRKPLNIALKSHEVVEYRISEIRELTENFILSDDCCPRLRVVLRQLKDLELNILEHKYLENNILFPRALEIESQLLKQNPD
jgi:regulator of cell morphogenesis and NO signaling